MYRPIERETPVPTVTLLNSAPTESDLFLENPMLKLPLNVGVRFLSADADKESVMAPAVTPEPPVTPLS
jgi:hypothetical protein